MAYLVHCHRLDHAKVVQLEVELVGVAALELVPRLALGVAELAITVLSTFEILQCHFRRAKLARNRQVNLGGRASSQRGTWHVVRWRTFDGTFDGTSDGRFDGTFDGTSDGRFDGTFDGTFEGAIIWCELARNRRHVTCRHVNPVGLLFSGRKKLRA